MKHYEYVPKQTKHDTMHIYRAGNQYSTI